MTVSRYFFSIFYKKNRAQYQIPAFRSFFHTGEGESRTRYRTEENKRTEERTRIKKNVQQKKKKNNKTLVKKIKNKASVKDILFFHREQGKMMNTIDIATCWNTIPRLLNKERRMIKKNPKVFLPLINHTIAITNDFDSRSLAMTANGYARIASQTRIQDESKLWEAIEEKAMNQGRKLNTREISMILWAFAKGKEHAPELFDAMVPIIKSKMNTLNSQDISNMAWAYATVGHDAPDLFDAVSETAIQKLDLFNPQDMANAVWAFATADHDAPNLFKAVSKAAILKIDSFNPQAMSNTAWAYAKIGHDAPDLFEAMSETAVLKLDLFNPQNMANTVWAFATVGHNAPNLFKAASKAAILKIDSFKPQELANTAWAYATVGHNAPDLFEALSKKAIRKLDLFTPQNIANTVWAYATVNHDAPALFKAVSETAIPKLDLFNPQDMANTAWAYAIVDHDAPDLFDAIEQIAIQKLDSFEQQAMVNLVWAYAATNADTDKAAPIFLHLSKQLQENKLTLSREGKRQLHQAFLWFNLEHGIEDSLLISKDVIRDCFKTFILKKSIISKFQKEVVKVFKSFGYQVKEEVICNKTGYSIDAVIIFEDFEVAVEVDGPSHFIGHRPNGKTLLKRRQLQNIGDRPLLSIAYWEWRSRDDEGRKMYVKQCLEELLSSQHKV